MTTIAKQTHLRWVSESHFREFTLCYFINTILGNTYFHPFTGCKHRIFGIKSTRTGSRKLHATHKRFFVHALVPITPSTPQASSIPSPSRTKAEKRSPSTTRREDIRPPSPAHPTARFALSISRTALASPTARLLTEEARPSLHRPRRARKIPISPTTPQVKSPSLKAETTSSPTRMTVKEGSRI